MTVRIDLDPQNPKRPAAGALAREIFTLTRTDPGSITRAISVNGVVAELIGDLELLGLTLLAQTTITRGALHILPPDARDRAADTLLRGDRGQKPRRSTELARELLTLARADADAPTLTISVNGVINELIDDVELLTDVLLAQAELARTAFQAVFDRVVETVLQSLTDRPY